MHENNEPAVEWLQKLEARGVIVTLGPTGRLRLTPARAYRELSDEEVLFLRHHREAIKRVVGGGPLTEERVSSIPFQEESSGRARSAPGMPSAEPPCSYCNRSPCIGESHPAFYALHPKAAQARDVARLNKEFRLQFGLPADDDEPTRPAPTDGERRQAALRRELGWDRGVLSEQRGYRHRE